MKTIKELWEDYHKNVYANVPISPIQYGETKQAFYAGILTFQSLLLSLPDRSKDEDEVAKELEKLRQECYAYMSKGGSKIWKR